MALVRGDELARPDGARSARRFLAHGLVYAGSIVLAELIGHPVAWLVAWSVMAFVLLGAMGASHEAIHNNLFVGRSGNRIAGTLTAASGLVPFAGYRAYHLAHHADTRGPTDPEPSEAVRGPFIWVLAMIIGGLQFVVIAWSAVVGAVIGRPPSWARHSVHLAALRRAALVSGAQVALIAVLAVTAPGPLLRWWVAPLAILWVGGLAAMVVIPEHNELEPGGEAFVWTRTTLSNPVFRWFFWNNNLHTAHHLVPSVPWCRLPVVHAAISERCQHVERGYLSYHRKIMRTDARRARARQLT